MKNGARHKIWTCVVVSWITKPVQSTALPTGRGIKSYTVSPYSLYTESRVLSVTIAIYSSYLLACSEKWSSVQDSNLRKLFASTLEGWRSTSWANTALKDMVRAVRFELTLILAPKASAIGQAKRRPDETIKTKSASQSQIKLWRYE